MNNPDTDNASSHRDFSSQLRNRTLDGLDASHARTTDRYLGTADGYALALKAKGYPLDSDRLKDLENTFATFHEEVLSQAINLITWGIALEQDHSQTSALRASETAFNAACGFAERSADDEWCQRVTSVVDSIAYQEGESTHVALVAMQVRLQARNRAAELFLRKQLFDAVMAVLYQRDLREAAVSSARAADETRTLTQAMVRATAVIAIATLFQAASAVGFVDWFMDLVTLH